MADSYFSKFPTIVYNNTLCRDLSRRIKIDDKTRNALTLYYTYTLEDGDRADIIADAYYKEPQMDWLLWLTNEIIDPYYDWHLSDRDFNDYLVKKYGSPEAAIKKIAYYRNNWYDDAQQITPSYYDNHLQLTWRKYYSPFYGKGAQILYYTRRQIDWTQETNKIYKLSVANTTPFVQDELVDVYTSATRSGGGEITAIADTYIMIKSIDGEFTINDSVVGETSNNGQTVTASELMYEAIAEDEGVFWSPVTYYDIENERNAYNRTILILDKAQTRPVLKQIETVLKE